jgi:hypothetical protein
MKRIIFSTIFIIVLASATYGQSSPLEGTWSGKIMPALFFDTIEYTFSGRTWRCQKFKNGNVTEIQEGTFTFSKDRIIMIISRYKSNGDWKEFGQTTGGDYVINGNTMTFGGMVFTRKNEKTGNTTPSRPDSAVSLYYSMTLPKDWIETTNNKNLTPLLDASGIDSSEGDANYQAYEDPKDNDNLLFIAEIAVPPGYTTRQLMANSPAQRQIYNRNEFYVMTEKFNSLSTIKSAYIVYKDAFYIFFFLLKNNSLYLADQSLETITFK